eukprot:CAMPEP_0204637428 /NCGR_PEP_ID=MMETSP0717-20131115/36592_1 /ASSEMBLY_ACC=CAM_ASM_000666 /TAXON_ID=230516 /ORGANISM="Chaetoceros curvisetus" /LENGTH=52 /DNA_ID=CAMNT_0051656835 /DNA_START=200 /DNA_END=354 /DNA_ORIENTATION=-
MRSIWIKNVTNPRIQGAVMHFEVIINVKVSLESSSSRSLDVSLAKREFRSGL